MFQIVAMFSFLSVLAARRANGNAKIQITVQTENKSRQFLVSPKTKVGKLRSLIAKDRKRKAKSVFSITMRYCGKVLCDDSATLEGAGLISGSIVECDFETLGGAGFSNIPVEKLPGLMCELEIAVNKWLATGTADTKDENGNPLVWNGLSSLIQKYFKANNIDPTVEYAKYYTKEKHTLATSYVWSKTCLHKMEGNFATISVNIK